MMQHSWTEEDDQAMRSYFQEDAITDDQPVRMRFSHYREMARKSAEADRLANRNAVLQKYVRCLIGIASAEAVALLAIVLARIWNG